MIRLNENLKRKINKGILNLKPDEENIIHCRGRLKNASLNYSAKFLVSLPSGNYFINLVINFCHVLVLHNGMKNVESNSYKVLDTEIKKSSKTNY